MGVAPFEMLPKKVIGTVAIYIHAIIKRTVLQWYYFLPLIFPPGFDLGEKRLGEFRGLTPLDLGGEFLSPNLLAH